MLTENVADIYYLEDNICYEYNRIIVIFS